MPRSNRVTLSDRLIRTAKVPAGRETIDVYDALAPGLVVRVASSGRRVFYVVFRRPGAVNKTWLRLLEYDGENLDTARTLARDAVTAVGKGRDLAKEQDAAAAAVLADAARTWKKLGEKYLEEYAKPNKKDKGLADASNIRTQLDPVWGDRPVSSIRRADVKALIAAIVKRGAKVRANRVLSLISKMLNFAVDVEWVDFNVAARIGKGKEQKRKTRLSDEQVLKFWQWCNAPADPALEAVDANNRYLFRALMKLRLITTARGNEILNMRWQDLEWSTEDYGPWWTIPETKNGLLQRLPITAHAARVLRDLEARATDLDPETYVFAGIRGKVQRRGQLTDFPVKKFLPRDLRRTATTNLAALEVPRFDVRRVLNHADGEVTRDYDEYAYGKEKRAALEKWDARLTVLTTPPAPGLRLVESA